MEKRILLNNIETDFWLEDTGRLRNEKTKRWLKGGTNKGYHFYSLYFRGKQYILYTHRAVAEYFIENDNKNEKTIVHHIDGNKLNNNYLNLMWVSPSEHAIQENYKKVDRSKPHIKIELNDYSLEDIAQFRNSPYYATKDGKIINTSKKILMKFENSGNYLRFVGNYNLNHKHFLVHRVIWEAFNGEIPENYDIDHIDGNPHNNALDNLQAISHKDNLIKRDIDWSYVVNNFNREK